MNHSEEGRRAGLLALGLRRGPTWGQTHRQMSPAGIHHAGQGGRGLDLGVSLSAQQQQVLRYLACGMTDACIAKHTHRSLRSIQRDVALLMVVVHTSSRFQAGVRWALIVGAAIAGGTEVIDPDLPLV